VRHARLIVMDEPTAALTDRETDALFALIGKLKAQGVAFVYIRTGSKSCRASPTASRSFATGVRSKRGPRVRCRRMR